MVAAALKRLNYRWLWVLVACLAAYSLYVPLSARLAPPPTVAEVFPHGTLRVGLDPSRPPFAYFEDDEYVGLEVELARALGTELDLPVQLVGLGFDGLYDALTTNQVDIVIAGLQPTFISDGNNAVYSRHYFDAGLVLVSQEGYETMRDLPGNRLAYEFGSVADAEAQRWLRRVRPYERQPYERPQYALDAVRLGQADAALVTATQARLYLRQHPTFNATYEHTTHAWYTVTARVDQPDMLALINATLQHLDDTGRLGAILDRWL